MLEEDTDRWTLGLGTRGLGPRDTGRAGSRRDTGRAATGDGSLELRAEIRAEKNPSRETGVASFVSSKESARVCI